MESRSSSWKCAGEVRSASKKKADDIRVVDTVAIKHCRKELAHGLGHFVRIIRRETGCASDCPNCHGESLEARRRVQRTQLCTRYFPDSTRALLTQRDGANSSAHEGRHRSSHSLKHSANNAVASLMDY